MSFKSEEKPAINGYSPRKNGFSKHGDEALIKCREEFYESFEETQLIVAVWTYIGYTVLVIFGYLRDLMRKYGLEKPKSAKEKGNEVRFNYAAQCFLHYVPFLKKNCSHCYVTNSCFCNRLSN